MRRFRLTLDVPDDIPDDYYRATILNALQSTFATIRDEGACQGSTRCTLDVTDDEGVRHIANTKVNFDWASPDVIGSVREFVSRYDSLDSNDRDNFADHFERQLAEMDNRLVKS